MVQVLAESGPSHAEQVSALLGGGGGAGARGVLPCSRDGSSQIFRIIFQLAGSIHLRGICSNFRKTPPVNPYPHSIQREDVPMSFIRGGRSAALAFFMAVLAHVAFVPKAEAASRDEHGRSDSVFDVALTVNNQSQSAHIEVSPEAQDVLGRAHGASARDVQLQSIVQERLQRLISEGKVQIPEGAKPYVIVKAQRGAEVTPTNDPSLQDTCFLPATYSVTYYIYFNSPSCNYYVATDYYNALYDQCTNTVYVMDYIGSTVVGPYAC